MRKFEPSVWDRHKVVLVLWLFLSACLKKHWLSTHFGSEPHFRCWVLCAKQNLVDGICASAGPVKSLTHTNTSFYPNSERNTARSTKIRAFHMLLKSWAPTGTHMVTKKSAHLPTHILVLMRRGKGTDALPSSSDHLPSSIHEYET